MVIFFQLKSSVRKFFTMIKNTNIPSEFEAWLAVIFIRRI